MIPKRWIVSIALVGLIAIFVGSFSTFWVEGAKADGTTGPTTPPEGQGAQVYLNQHRDHTTYSGSETWDGTGDGATGVIVGVSDVIDAQGTSTPVSLGAFQVELRYDGTCIEILDIRAGRDFTMSAEVINDSTGVAYWSGYNVSGDYPDSIMGFALVRLEGAATVKCNLEVVFTELVDVDGYAVPVDPTAVIGEFQRANVRQDTLLSIADVLLGAQYLAGLRPGCTDVVPPGGTGPTTCANVVNMASVRQDSPRDITAIADVLFMAQRLAGMKDDNFQ